MSYKYLGLLAAIFLIIGLSLVLYKWPQNRHKTFSQHVALRRASIIYYGLLFFIVSPALVVFFVGWFTPHFGISNWLNVFAILAATLQIACTLVPEVGGIKTRWHRALAGLSAISLIPVLALLLLYPTITLISKMLVAISLLVMIGCVYIVLKARGGPRNFLLIQCFYFSAFLIPILFISYLQ